MKLIIHLIVCGVLSVVASSVALASQVPNVVVSIKPLHAWASAVMEGVGTPELLVKGTGSEHGYALKPSDADMLSKANIVFIDNKHMETFLVKPLETLAPKAEVVALSEASGVKLLPLREGGMFDPHHHGDEHGSEHADHDHNHGEHDLHFWLDPMNAVAATYAIADDLSKLDPDHAARYHANAEKYVKTLKNTIDQIQKKVAPYKGLHFIVFHDAYHYFENRFGLKAAGSITIDPEHQPGAKRLQTIHQKIKDLNAVCVFSEPQFEPAVVSIVIEGTNAKKGVLDPLGVNLEPGKDAYPALLNEISDSLIKCAQSQ